MGKKLKRVVGEQASRSLAMWWLLEFAAAKQSLDLSALREMMNAPARLVGKEPAQLGLEVDLQTAEQHFFRDC